MGLTVETKDKNTLEGESIVCFAGEDWWYHHPHSKNHLLKRYALRNKVLFVNSISMGLPSMANPDFFLKIKRKLRSYTRWLRKVPEGLWVMTPVNLPLYGSRIGRWLNRILLVAQLRLAMLLLRISRPILWVAIPTAAEMAGRLGEKLLLYQVSDKYDANEDSALSAQVIRKYDRQLKDAADLVMYSGRKLFQEATEPNRFFLEQAVDFEHFSNLNVQACTGTGGHPPSDPRLFRQDGLRNGYRFDGRGLAASPSVALGAAWSQVQPGKDLGPECSFPGLQAVSRRTPICILLRRVCLALASEKHLHQLRKRHQGARVSGYGEAGSYLAAL